MSISLTHDRTIQIENWDNGYAVCREMLVIRKGYENTYEAHKLKQKTKDHCGEIPQLILAD